MLGLCSEAEMIFPRPSLLVLKTDKLSRKEDNGHPSVVQNQRNRWQNLPVSLPPVLSRYLFIIVISIIVVVLKQ